MLIRDRMLPKDRPACRDIRDENIASYVLHNHADKEGQKRLYDLYYFKEEIERMICDGKRWEKNSKGFFTRRNYAFNRDGEITFDVYYISKIDGEYVSDGSEVANQHFIEVAPQLDELTKIERYIDSLCAEHQEEIDKALESHREYRRLRGASAHVQFMEGKQKNDNYLYFYGREGQRLLIKWLNRLNEPTSTEDLLPALEEDVNNAIGVLESIEYGPYLTSKELGINMSYLLMSVLERYHSRGKELKFTYCTQKIQEPTTQKGTC